jgi:choice-of-anchor A domain-containing protein
MTTGMVGLGAASASAATLTTKEILADFNAVVYTNGSTPSDIEGAAVIGGNFSGATVFNSPNDGGSRSQPTGYGALTVFGSTSGNTIDIDNSGDAYVGGVHGATISFNGGHYIAAPGNTIGDFETPLNKLSTTLKGLTPNSTFHPDLNDATFNATPGANGVAVFDVTSSALDASGGYQINFNKATTVIIDVDASGTAGVVNFHANALNIPTADDNYIIWNFYNATSVGLGTTIGGTVIAPLANVSNGTQIDGDLVAKSWTGSGELHSYTYEGWLPPSGAPEPATWAMMILGLGLVGVLARRRGAAAPATA